MLRMTIRFISFLTIAQFLTAAALASPQQAQIPPKPLTNGDVIKMVKAGLATGTIVSAIEASQTDFDVSPDALISLKTAGVTEPVMNAMIAAQSNKRDAGSGFLSALTNVAGAAGAARSELSPLHVNLFSPAPASGTAGSQVARPMTAERTHLADTQTKVKSLGGLVTDWARSCLIAIPH